MSLIINIKNFKKIIKDGFSEKRAFTFIILQLTMTIVFTILYYIAILFDDYVYGIKPGKDYLQADILSVLYFSLITQTTVGYTGGLEYLSSSTKVINFLHLLSMLVVVTII